MVTFSLSLVILLLFLPQTPPPVTGKLASRAWFLFSRSTAGSQLGSMFECGRRTSSWIGLIPKVHGCDKTGVHGEYVENFAIRYNIPLKVPDELVHSDADL